MYLRGTLFILDTVIFVPSVCDNNCLLLLTLYLLLLWLILFIMKKL